MSVLDASALLAYVFGESGAEEVERRLPGSVVHAVNWAEVLSTLAEKGVGPEQAAQQLEEAGVSQLMRIELGTLEDALEVARLRPVTRSLGLGIGDRYCLALAKRLTLPAVTADQAWMNLAVEVQCIR